MLRVVSHWIQVPTKRAGYLLSAFLWQAARFEPARSSKPEPEPEPEPNGEASAKAAGRLAFGAGAAVSVPGEGESFANPVAEAGDDDGGNATVRPPSVSICVVLLCTFILCTSALHEAVCGRTMVCLR